MTEQLNIHQRLHAVMGDVKYIQKEDKKVNGQYTFVSHDAVTAKCRESFVKHRIVVIPTTLEHTIESGKNKRGETIYRTILLISTKFVNIDNPEDFIETLSYGYGIDNQDKGIGKAYSYAYKYALLKTLGLETGDDPERDDIDFVPEITELNPEQQEHLYETALRMLGEQTELEKLKIIWEENYKKWGKHLTDEQFHDIEAKKDECKEDLNGQ